MVWSKAGNRNLIELIVDTFRDSPERTRERLSTFALRDWEQTEFWLDVSGLALYFFDCTAQLELHDALPTPVLDRLRRKLADNAARHTDMLAEFTALNNAFSAAGVRFANLKGFTLSPYSCPNPVLRHQIDLDFLVDPAHLPICRKLLEGRGYCLAGAPARTWEFKSGGEKSERIEDLYKPVRSRSVELHWASETALAHAGVDPRLHRLASWSCSPSGPVQAFPALAPTDQLLGQALHIFGHLRGESTKPSWLLEYRRHVLARCGDSGFWPELRLLARETPYAATALALSTLLATELFGPFAPPELESWTLDRLPQRLRLWAAQYGRRVLLADFPGTKLYLLLEGELHRGLSQTTDREAVAARLRRLVPLHRAPRILPPTPQETLLSRLRRQAFQTRFLVFRLRFHLRQGIGYGIEARRWKRFIRGAETSVDMLESLPRA